MFNCLNQEELQIIIMAIRQVSFKAGDVVIREGEDGDDLYAVASGSLTCTKIMVSVLKS